MTPADIIDRARATAGGWNQLATESGATRASLYRWRAGAVPSPRFWFGLAQLAGVDVSQVLAAWGVGAQRARKSLPQ